MEIAVLVDEDGRASSFDKIGSVRIYEKINGCWSIKQEKRYDPSDFNNAFDLRKELRNICVWLSTCRVFVASHVKGIHLAILREYNLSIWERGQDPLLFLTQVNLSENLMKRRKKRRISKSMTSNPCVLEKKEEGVFLIDIRSAMGTHENMTSKSLLRPILNTLAFEKLQVICLHEPKWLAQDLPAQQLVYDTCVTPEYTIVSITHL